MITPAPDPQCSRQTGSKSEVSPSRAFKYSVIGLIALPSVLLSSIAVVILIAVGCTVQVIPESIMRVIAVGLSFLQTILDVSLYPMQPLLVTLSTHSTTAQLVGVFIYYALSGLILGTLVDILRHCNRRRSHKPQLQDKYRQHGKPQ
jgi:hypothetical protein